MNDRVTIANVWVALSDELRAFLRSRLPSASDADDILQDVFVRVTERIGSLREAERLESWVYQIARNAVADYYRRRPPRPTDVSEDVPDEYAEDRGENQNEAVGAWLLMMIEGLPQALRDAVRMYEVEGLTQAGIAQRLGISLPAAKSRVQRGRRRLEEMLRGCCHLELDRRGNVIECKPVSLVSCSTQSCSCNGNTH